MNKFDPYNKSIELPKYAAVLAISLLILAQSAVASNANSDDEDSDIYTTYAPIKNGCEAEFEELILFSKNAVKGPNFSCELLEGEPAGTGMVNHAAVCTVDGKFIKDFVTFDLGNYDDHFEVSLPGRAEWNSMYPCTDVNGLKR